MRSFSNNLARIDFIQVTSPTPILNTPDFSFAFGGKSGVEIPRNEKGLPYFYEFVALPGTIFKVEERCSEHIHRVSCPFYEQPNLFLDRRFAHPAKKPFSPKLPPKAVILERMKALLGIPYVWGGNWSRGIEKLLRLYPPKGPIDEKTKTDWILQGVDCSGLLYETTGGATPRNTSQLIHFGKSLKIKQEDIFSSLQPLDMIVYPGHVLFVLDETHTIESRFPLGVMHCNIEERIRELTKERVLVDEWSSALDPKCYFLLRRFS